MSERDRVTSKGVRGIHVLNVVNRRLSSTEALTKEMFLRSDVSYVVVASLVTKGLSLLWRHGLDATV